MKIAVICANGKAGTLITAEALNRGLDVTAVVRSENKTAAKQVIRKDLFDLTAADLAGFDVVVVARVRAASSDYHQLEKSFLRLADKLGLLKKGEGG